MFQDENTKSFVSLRDRIQPPLERTTSLEDSLVVPMADRHLHHLAWYNAESTRMLNDLIILHPISHFLFRNLFRQSLQARIDTLLVDSVRVGGQHANTKSADTDLAGFDRGVVALAESLLANGSSTHVGAHFDREIVRAWVGVQREAHGQVSGVGGCKTMIRIKPLSSKELLGPHQKSGTVSSLPKEFVKLKTSLWFPAIQIVISLVGIGVILKGLSNASFANRPIFAGHTDIDGTLVMLIFGLMSTLVAFPLIADPIHLRSQRQRAKGNV